jgi:predicted ester cyclase
MMKLDKLVMGLALTLSVTACKKKDEAGETPAAKPADNPGGTAAKPEPAKPEPAKPAPPKPMTGPEIAAQYQKCSQLLGDHKFDDFKKTCVSDDYVGHEMGQDMKADQLTAMFTEMATAFPDMKAAPQLIIVNGKTILAMSLMSGTHEGTMKMPGMPDVPATHKKFVNAFFHRLALGDDNRVKEEWAIEDPTTFMSQLGLTPKGGMPHRTLEDMKPLDGAPVVVVAADDAKEKGNLEIVGKWTAAFNAHKSADLMALMTDDAVETEWADAKDHKGKKEIEPGLKAFQAGFSDGKVTVDGSWAAGDYVVVSGTFDGTNDHDMGKMKKTGKHVSAQYVEILQLKDGKASHVWRFTDTMAMAIQLGLMPKPGEAPAGEAPKGGDAKGGDAKGGDAKAPAGKGPAKK